MVTTNKNGIYCMVKDITMWDAQNYCLFKGTFEADYFQGKNVRVMQSEDYSMMKLDFDDWFTNLYCTTTDSVGDGVHFGLQRELDKATRLYPNASFRLCFLHALSLMHCNAVTIFSEMVAQRTRIFCKA